MASFIYLWIFIILLGPMAILGCHDKGAQADGKIIGGPCQYREIEGHATIIAIQEDAENDAGCKDAVAIIFNFSPADTLARNAYRFQHPDTKQRLTVGAGLNPSKAWARHMGLVKGATLRCIRKELIQGTCTPVIFDFPDLDFTGWEKWCFKPSSKKP